jgi:hypothetical protein
MPVLWTLICFFAAIGVMTVSAICIELFWAEPRRVREHMKLDEMIEAEEFTLEELTEWTDAKS